MNMSRQTNKFSLWEKSAVLLIGMVVLTSSCSFLTGEDTTATTTTEATDTSSTGSGTDGTTDTGTTVITSPAGTDTAEAGSLNSSASLSTAGLGPVAIGHTLEQATEASGATFRLKADVSAACKLYVVDSLAGVSFVAVDDEIVRIDITAGPITTLSGYGIGSFESELRSAFGERIETGPTANEVQYVPVDTSDIDKRVVWRLDARSRVTALRTGRVPHVNAPTTCQ